jgi:hypothetical protein
MNDAQKSHATTPKVLDMCVQGVCRDVPGPGVCVCVCVCLCVRVRVRVRGFRLGPLPTRRLWAWAGGEVGGYSLLPRPLVACAARADRSDQHY